MGRRHGTDKWDASHSFLGESYLDVYERYLSPMRRRPVTVLELGVKGGGSLRMWKEFFPRGDIHGVDLNPRCQEETEERITVHAISQDDEAGLTALAEAVGGFDVVLDDASHINVLTVASFRILWPHVKPGGFYIIEDLGMSWVDYAQLDDQDTFMDGELKLNTDRGVPAHQDRSTLDAVFREILYAIDNRIGAARFLHFWHGTALIQRAGLQLPVAQPPAIPLLRLTDLLPADRYRALVHADDGVVDDRLHEIWNAVEAAIQPMAGLVRRELGLPHFSVDGLAAIVTAHRDHGAFRTALVGAPGPGTRRVDFVYTFGDGPEPSEPAHLVLHGPPDGDGSRRTTTSIDLVDNAIVLFPSGIPHDIVPSMPRHRDTVRYVLTGWLTDEARSPAPPAS